MNEAVISMRTRKNRKSYHKLTNQQKKYIKVKSIIDRTLAVIGLFILSPVFLAIIVMCKFEDGWNAPVFISQKRVGIHKTYFKLYKFRSMKTDTPHDTPTHLLTNPEQYITKIGKFLRKTSLDELPQLWNIARGDMAIIGPRPALWNQFDLIEERDRYGVHQIKPGLTGWAQIHGRDELEIKEKARLDGYYLRHLGPAIDIRSFFGTIASVWRSDGVVEGGTGTLHASEKKTRKKVMVITNHSYMLWQFRRELIAELKKEHELVITLEDGILEGGFGEKIASFYGTTNMKVKNYGIRKSFPDRYIVDELLKENGITVEQIIVDIKEIIYIK